MPELPEVEVTRRQLSPLLVGRTIRAVATTRPSRFFVTPPRTLARRLLGRRVLTLERRGKYLLARLDDDARLLLHLGMTGQLFAAGIPGVRLLSSTRGSALAPEQQAEAFRPDSHTHLIIRFSDGGPDVLFRDVRKFGRVQWLAAGESSPRLDRLGVDALQARPVDLWSATRGRRRCIKALLLDQSVLAGVGNIYADEALFLAGVRPSRRAGRVSRAEGHRLLAGLKRVLQRSLATGGSSISDYIQPGGGRGRYQDERRVYGRTGEPCRRCRTPIVRRLIAQRGSHFCPRCQS
jgi:formamidopyrimidine-DNA glycosylase